MTDPEKRNLQQIQTNTTDAAELDQPVKVDTVHGDEATKVLANYNGPLEWTPDEEKKLVRKVDRRLLSILVLTYGLQYYDKAMLSQAVRSTQILRISYTVLILHHKGTIRPPR